MKKFEEFNDWTWDIIEDQWTEVFEILKDYYKTFQTSKIAATKVYKNVKLGGWVRKQRFDYKSNKLQNMKIRLLENTFHDWSWDVLKDSWDTNFEIMKQYCEEFKTLWLKTKKI